MKQTVLAAALALAWGLSLQPPALAAHDAEADHLVAGFLEAYAHVRTFMGRINVVTDVGGNLERSKFLLALAKPNSTAMTVLSEPSMRAAEGTKIVWLGGPTCEVSTRFFGFPLHMSAAYDDKRLRGARGDTMYDLSVAYAVVITKARGASFKLLRKETYLGRPMHVLEIRSPKLLSGIDHEVLWLDDALHLPFQRDMLVGDKVAYHVAVETFAFDKPLPADTFKNDR